MFSDAFLAMSPIVRVLIDSVSDTNTQMKINTETLSTKRFAKSILSILLALKK